MMPRGRSSCGCAADGLPQGCVVPVLHPQGLLGSPCHPNNRILGSLALGHTCASCIISRLFCIYMRLTELPGDLAQPRSGLVLLASAVNKFDLSHSWVAPTFNTMLLLPTMWVDTTVNERYWEVVLVAVEQGGTSRISDILGINIVPWMTLNFFLKTPCISETNPPPFHWSQSERGEHQQSSSPCPVSCSCT